MTTTAWDAVEIQGFAVAFAAARAAAPTLLTAAATLIDSTSAVAQCQNT